MSQHASASAPRDASSEPSKVAGKSIAIEVSAGAAGTSHCAAPSLGLRCEGRDRWDDDGDDDGVDE